MRTIDRDHAAALSPLRPAVCRQDFTEAHQMALDGQEPVLVPVEPFLDDRGWSLMNLLGGVLSERGQINVSLQLPGVVKAWHAHQRQTDFWICVGGHLKAGVFREEDQTAWMAVFGERRPGVLIIPPGLWHGATAVGSGPATLLYYVTHAYDARDPDELRRPHDGIAGFPWTTRHG